MLTKEYITTRLTALANARGVTIRYANESGSRAWGLASTDSDYDVRFVYQHPREWYLRLDRPKDMIGPLLELDGELDLAGWDLRKVMSHLAGSNAGVIEWLHSPVNYYLENSFLERLRALEKACFQPAKVTAHYLGIARSAELAGYDKATGDWNLKKFFYFLRPLLAANYVADERIAPPVAFADLQARIDNSALSQTITALIRHKETVDEGHRMKIPVPLLDFAETLSAKGEARLAELPRFRTNRELADDMFRELIGY